MRAPLGEAGGAAGAGPVSPTAIGALVIFLLSVAGVVLLVLRPVTLRLRLPARCAAAAGRGALALHVPHWAAPPAGVLLMLAARALDGPGLLRGIKGAAAVGPNARAARGRTPLAQHLG
jgi:hypothetical protein